MKGYRYEKCGYIGDRLRHLQSQEMVVRAEYEQRGHKEYPLPAAGQKAGLPGETEALVELIDIR